MLISNESVQLNKLDRLNEICKCIVRSNYLQSADCLPEQSEVFKAKLNYRYYLPSFGTFTQFDTQEKYDHLINSQVNKEKQEATSQPVAGDGLLNDYVNFEVEVDIR